MSNDNNRNDGLQDYLDLLQEYANREPVEEPNTQAPTDEEELQIDTENLADVVDADFFDNFKVEIQPEEEEPFNISFTKKMENIESVSEPHKILQN